jgi:hypothetical protein
MANVLAILSVQQLDYLGTKASHDIFLLVADTRTVANLQTYVDSYLTVYAALTGAKTLDCQVKLHMAITNGNSSAVAGDEEEKTALLAFDQTGTRYVASIDIPAIRETLIVNGKVDLTPSGPVDDYVLFLQSAVTGVTPVGKFEDTITSLRTVALTFRKHRRSLNRTSSETP